MKEITPPKKQKNPIKKRIIITNMLAKFSKKREQIKSLL
jgi:hypothetical protein